MRNLWAAESKEPKSGPPPGPADGELPKARRPLTHDERQELQKKIERAKQTDPNIYPLW